MNGAATPARATNPSDAVVAVVGDLVLRRRHVDERLDAVRDEAGAGNLPAEGSPEADRLRRWIVHALVEEAVVEAEARSRDIAVSRAGPAAALDPAVVTAVFEAVTADVVVTADEVAAYHRRNLETYAHGEVRVVRQLLAADPAAAERLVEHARRDGLRAAARRSAGDPIEEIEEIEEHEVSPGRRGRAFDDAVFAALVGDVVGPLPGPLGWLVVEVVEVLPTGVAGLADVGAAITQDLLAARRGRRFDAWRAARRRQLARIEPGNEHPGDPRVPGHVHRH